MACMHPDPAKRPSAVELMQLPYFASMQPSPLSSPAEVDAEVQRLLGSTSTMVRRSAGRASYTPGPPAAAASPAAASPAAAAPTPAAAAVADATPCIPDLRQGPPTMAALHSSVRHPENNDNSRLPAADLAPKLPDTYMIVDRNAILLTSTSDDQIGLLTCPSGTHTSTPASLRARRTFLDSSTCTSGSGSATTVSGPVGLHCSISLTGFAKRLAKVRVSCSGLC